MLVPPREEPGPYQALTSPKHKNPEMGPLPGPGPGPGPAAPDRDLPLPLERGRSHFKPCKTPPLLLPTLAPALTPLSYLLLNEKKALNDKKPIDANKMSINNEW